jgi:predicted RNA-binding protein YlxR (DUF448 family)
MRLVVADDAVMDKREGQAANRKHIPQRTCVVCRETAAKRALVRVVRTADQGVQLDLTGKKNGRGAYVCTRPECWQRAFTSTVLDKALRTTLTEDERVRLSEAMANLVQFGQR